MQTSAIIAAINEEISRLEQVRSLLSGDGHREPKRGPKPAAPATAFPFGASETAGPRKRRTMSAAGRVRIAAAQKARWAKLKKVKAEKK